jgi:hypothetical protein
MGGDRLRLDQGHVVDEQTHDAFALAGVDTRVLPNPRQLLGEIEDASAGLGVEGQSLLLTVALVLLGSFGMKA